LYIYIQNKFSYNPQTGEAQLNSSPTYQRHVSCTVFGINHRKVTPLFNQKAMRQVNLDVFDGNSSSLKISFNGSENLVLGQHDDSTILSINVTVIFYSFLCFRVE